MEFKKVVGPCLVCFVIGVLMGVYGLSWYIEYTEESVGRQLASSEQLLFGEAYTKASVLVGRDANGDIRYFAAPMDFFKYDGTGATAPGVVVMKTQNGWIEMDVAAAKRLTDQ